MRRGEHTTSRSREPEANHGAAAAAARPQTHVAPQPGPAAAQVSRMVALHAQAIDDEAIARSAELSFEAVLLGGGDAAAAAPTIDQLDVASVYALAQRTQRAGLALVLDIDLHRAAADSALARQHPNWFRQRVAAQWPLDPRRDMQPAALLPRFDFEEAAHGFVTAAIEQLVRALEAGASGFAVHWPQRVPPALLKQLVGAIKRAHKRVALIAWAPGLSSGERATLASSGFDASFCSLPWWDYRAPWFVDELAELSHGAAVLAPVDWPHDIDPERAARAFARALAFAQFCTGGWLLRQPRWLRQSADVHNVAAAQITKLIETANRTLAQRATRTLPQCVSAPWAQVGIWVERGEQSRLTLVNPDLDHHANVAAAAVECAAGVAAHSQVIPLAPGEVRNIALATLPVAVLPRSEDAVKKALSAARVLIEDIAPVVDDGRFAVKRTLGDTLSVEADVFADGHPTLAVQLLWRAADEQQWHKVRMRALGNDRWRGEFPLQRLGTYQYTIEGGIDEFASLRADLEKKVAAGQNVALEVDEARALMEHAARRAPAELRTRARELVREISTAPQPAVRVLAPDCAALMAQACPPAFVARAAKIHCVSVERCAARCAAWYELFPRSQGAHGRHGTLRDVIAQLPRIAALGFDVLYFPPIHPIGSAQRKGRNNSLNAQPGEPGSPYAIGSAEGGHDAIHPQLGTLADFQALVAAAKSYGLEIALDFAVQCSPDHPWIKAHPEWFAWRPDGSLRYAENPPKKYEDIVNVDFYAKGAKPALWIALRDVVAFWMRNGVKTFRVDNPHTKPLPFWEWLIADLRSIDPDVVFLSEAFTRPKLMYRLAKLGFSQSYTYFTWRNTRAELQTYLTELNSAPVREFFRPHFFVNTPDINPTFLHTSGRPGFLIRAVLAATLSGLWGMYSGFELCEAAPIPGKEEYLDSEKYELRPRDWNAPGNIAAQIAQLNRIRRANPALHTHLGIAFYNCTNSNILYFAKSTPARDNVLLIAVCLDPHHAQEADIELPLWEWGLDDGALLCAEDLVHGHAFDWRGKLQHVRLDPAALPYAIWRARPERER